MQAVNLTPKQLRAISSEIDRIQGDAAISDIDNPVTVDNVRIAEGINCHVFTFYAEGEILAIVHRDRNNVTTRQVFA